MTKIGQRRPLLIAIAVAAIVSAVWFYVFFSTSPQQTLDQQARDVGEQLRCPVCQGESVADSPSGIAQQMRGVIREQLQAGKSEQQIIQYFQDRYGNQIVWSPQWQGFAMMAWLVPIVLVLGGFVLLFFVLRDWHKAIPVGTPTANEVEIGDIDERELARYRARLERELAEEDPIFMHKQTSEPRGAGRRREAI
jgi:cytochrome c-type biogenesis protein CcmH